MSELTMEQKLERLLKVDFYLDKIPGEKHFFIFLNFILTFSFWI